MDKKVKTENDCKKEYLRKYRTHVRRIARIESDLEELRMMKCYPSLVCGNGMPHSSNSNDLSNYAAAVDSKERDLLNEKCQRVKEYQEISNQIEQLDNEKERDVLHYRYIKGLGWWEIAEKMNYSERQIHRYHGRALKNFKYKNKDVSECQCQV